MAGRAKKRAKVAKPTNAIAERAAKIGLPPEQVARGNLVPQDVANRTEADQRHMTRSGDTETVRKLTRVEMLLRNGSINRDEAAACEWFADVHAMAWDTVGCTANYQGAGGGGFGSSDLLARYRWQAEARADYWFARDFIAPQDRELFELVVCKNHSIGDAAEAIFDTLKRSQAMNRATLQLRRAANMLHSGIAHRLPA